MKTLNEILDHHAESGGKLTVQEFIPDLEDYTDDPSIEYRYTLIRGTSQSLRFLGELLIQFADEDDGGSFNLHPDGAGCIHFSDGSTRGLLFVKEAGDQVPK